jgi:hypothetical protein
VNPLTQVYLVWLWLLVVLLVLAALLWTTNSLHSLVVSVQLARARLSEAGRLAGTRAYQADEYEALPVLWQPFYSYSRAHLRVARRELATPPGQLLVRFESLLTASAPRAMSFARFGSVPQGDERLCSLVAIYPLGYLSLGLAWITLEPRGPYLECTIYCSEVRTWRTPTEANSHFPFPRRAEFQLSSHRGTDSECIVETWNWLSLGNTSEYGARQAEYLERLVKELWAEVLHPPHGAPGPGLPQPGAPAKPPRFQGVPRPSDPAQPQPRPRRPQPRS